MTPQRINNLINIAISSFFIFIGIITLAIWVYPGTTFHDHTTVGYIMSLNFLSDLGRTVTYIQEPNFFSSTLFVLGTVCVCIGLTAYFITFPFVVKKNKISHYFAWAGSVAGIISGMAFMGIGFTPDNYYHQWHMFFVHIGFQSFMVVMVLHSIAIAINEDGLNKKSILIYFIFGCVLGWYIYLLNFGPTAKDPENLPIHVISQKITVLGLSATVFVQSLMMKFQFGALSQRQ